MSAWSDLPNAHQIDRVIASVKEHPKIWDAVHIAAWDATRDAAWSAALNAAWSAAWDVTRSVDLDAARSAAWFAARDVARDAILALVAYDNCEQYLSMTSEELQAWALLTEQPAAVLLLPAVVAFERIAELETV